MLFYTKSQVDQIATIVGNEIKNNKVSTATSIDSWIAVLDEELGKPEGSSEDPVVPTY